MSLEVDWSFHRIGCYLIDYCRSRPDSTIATSPLVLGSSLASNPSKSKGVTISDAKEQQELMVEPNVPKNQQDLSVDATVSGVPQELTTDPNAPQLADPNVVKPLKSALKKKPPPVPSDPSITEDDKFRAVLEKVVPLLLSPGWIEFKNRSSCFVSLVGGCVVWTTALGCAVWTTTVGCIVWKTTVYCLVNFK
jgi:hypothetical protein